MDRMTLNISVIFEVLSIFEKWFTKNSLDCYRPARLVERAELRLNSLIIKRVLFEVFDCFLPLFYIAFYQLNVVALRRELVGLFWGKCVSEVIPLWDTLFFGGWGNWECHLSKKWIICSCVSTDSIFRFTNFFAFLFLS